MKTILLLTGLLLAGTAAFAQDGGDGPKGKMDAERFGRMKEAMLKDMDARIAMMRKFRDCINAAADHEAFKKCHDEQHAADKAYEAARRQDRIREIDERQKQLEHEKQELQKKDSDGGGSPKP